VQPRSVTITLKYIEMTKTNTNFDLALIDLDSHIYSIAWVNDDVSYCRKVLMQNVEKMIEDLEVPEAYVFIKGKSNFRYLVDPEYKANRKKIMDPEIAYRIDQLYDYAKTEFIEADGGEADDYCCIYAHQALAEGKMPVVVHIDKDLNMIPGWHYNPKKGTKDGLYFTSAQDSFVFMSKQILTGDSADNIPGIRGTGPVGAQKGLQNKYLHEFRDRIRELWRQGGEKSGFPDWEDRMYKSFNCLLLRESMDEMRPLTREELDKKMSWTATEERYMAGITENTAMIANSITPTEKGEIPGGPAFIEAVNNGTLAEWQKKKQVGDTLEKATSTQTYTTDSSTE